MNQNVLVLINTKCPLMPVHSLIGSVFRAASKQKKTVIHAGLIIENVYATEKTMHT